MNGLDKILDHIKSASEAECAEILHESDEECRRIRAIYSKTEQDEYWKYIDTGTKEAQRRGQQLTALAEDEANKQILATQRELMDEAFALAATKLLGIDDGAYRKLLSKLKLKPGSGPQDVISKIREQYKPGVSSVLFD